MFLNKLDWIFHIMTNFFKFWVRIVNSPLRFLLISFATLIFSSSFDRPVANASDYPLTSDEKAWMEPFFRGVMLQQGAIYTLCGSKPMTMISLDDEQQLLAENQKAKREKKKRIVLEDYHLLQNWEKWESIKSHFPLHRYLFFKKHATLYFADMTKVALALQEHYNVFKKETGLDFDPLSESLALERGSEFWDKTWDHPALLGLLLGYGIKNSFCFQWKYANLSDTHEKLAGSLLFQFTDQPQGGKATFDKLSLPIFASFSEGEDEVVEKYKREREAIRDIYEDKNFLSLTLQKLMRMDR
jgi:hypothetical protein